MKRGTPAALPFAGIMLLGAFWAICSTLELANEMLAAKILWNKLHFLLPILAVVTLFWIVLKFRGDPFWFAPKRSLSRLG